MTKEINTLDNNKPQLDGPEDEMTSDFCSAKTWWRHAETTSRSKLYFFTPPSRRASVDSLIAD